MQIVGDVPGAKQGKVSLKISRRYKKEATEIAHEASIRSSQSKLDRLEGDADANCDSLCFSRAVPITALSTDIMYRRAC